MAMLASILESPYRANESELHALRYYANSIAHLCKQLDLPTKSELR